MRPLRKDKVLRFPNVIIYRSIFQEEQEQNLAVNLPEEPSDQILSAIRAPPSRVLIPLSQSEQWKPWIYGDLGEENSIEVLFNCKNVFIFTQKLDKPFCYEQFGIF